MSALLFLERPARAEPAGLLILHHGRGADERDLFSLADSFDPDGRLHVVSPRAPLHLRGMPGYHWYVVPRVGHPDPVTFGRSCDQLAEFHEQTWTRYGLDASRTILGGFSMGAVLSYALGLGESRPAPAGILALSGFLPEVDGWELDIDGRAQTPVLIAHGRRDQVIDVGFGRAARARLERSGYGVDYHESAAMHNIDPAVVPSVVRWIAQALAVVDPR
jgi:phospholipase/carboxylesterase